MRRETIGRPMEILLLEDNWDDARLAFELLRGAFQHRLTWLSDGAEALEFLKKRGKYARVPSPDVILLDLSLPRRDGREVLSDLKSDPELKSIPVVVLTGSLAHEDILRSELLLVEGYVSKPIDSPKLLALIHDLKRFWHADLILPVDPAEPAPPA